MLNDLLGIDIKTFDGSIRGRKAGVFSSRDMRFADVFGWDVLNEVLDGSERYVERISLIREDARLDARLFTGPAQSGRLKRVVPSAVRQALANGYSILLDAVHEYSRAASDLSDYITNAVGETASINCYVSWSTDKCFLTHWDDHDVFIIQTEGQKEWSVFRPTRPDPLYSDVKYEAKPDDLDLYWEGTLEPGKVLYIPRGWWHHAKATGEGSIHLTVGFTGRTPLNLLDHLVARACETDAFRANLERPGSPAYDERKREVENLLVEFIQRAIKNGAVDEFWRQHYARMPSRALNNLPVTIDPDVFRRDAKTVQFSGLASQVTIETENSGVTLEIGGRRITFAPEVGPLLQRLAQGDVVSLGDLAGHAGSLTNSELQQLAFELVNEGVIHVVEQESRRSHR